MAHSLTPPPPVATPISTRTDDKRNTTLPSLGFPRKSSVHRSFHQAVESHASFVDRRSLIWGMTLAVTTMGANKSVNAAQRRPPPSAPKEKKDPNVSGVQAKVLASMKRKEAMKDAVAKLKEKGKPIYSSPSE
ncbi:hypothetical protein GIB67_008425 [Kingdonia uniflora]|uniref:Uncharacterized protein n=1 Tax=Kingdonia uniflora TaxID=39325 RepID=A0A7J7L4C6_9MAGN|nr:hypothetical protein GIB67_027863 [Kingdonia uniflora]KAF6162296.1 hypothetical protein GIB67_008425 [Kingdonia uniflora]